ncbi:helicase-related protein [Rhodopila sp.]|uniref:helicase-related protein n=1 Tax=Rhodopila sp. TaxID=2480087 RepID=UPI003D09B5C6
MELSVGIKVTVRGLEWDVTEILPLGSQKLVRLTCRGGDLAGLEWDVLHPAEPIAVTQIDPRPEEAGPLADWRRFHLARLLEQIPGPSAAPGRVAIEAYQRVPLLRALDMVRPRLLLADGVGLGKTIQAGLIAAELLVRRRAHRVLIVCPPGPLLGQWEQEMRVRFGLRFTPIADAAGLRQARRGLELGANPFDATALCLTSMDFAKSDHVLAELERAAWDLVIIDEAHHCVGEENQRRRLAAVLAGRSDGLLLLTATPHDGNDANFAALIALLDPSLVDAAGRLVGSGYRRHVVRRLKSHIRTAAGAPLFRERIVVPVRVEVGDARPVAAFHRALSALVAPRLQRSRDRAGLSDALAFVSLLKRSMSSIAACVSTLRVVAARYPAKPLPDRRRALRAWRRRAGRYGVLGPAEEAEIALLEAEEMAASMTDQQAAQQLAELIRLGEAALPLDPKLAALVLEVRLIRLRHADANVLVYTEYTDSQSAAVAALAEVGGVILSISGADSEADRARVAERFAEQDGIVLVSTDSLAEGLNLQRKCFHLIHLDLPYNPNRLEQRNGRIDRYGQRLDPEIRYLFLAGTFEERLLLRLIAKYEKARACLAFMPNTLGVGADPARLHEPLVAGFAEDLFSGAPRLVHSLDLAAEDSDSEAYRDLLREIDRAFQSFDQMAVRHGWLSGGEAAEIAGTPGIGAPSATVDLPAFVASVLTAFGDGYRVPAAWAGDLDGLAGFDRATGSVRLSNDAEQLRDADGRELLYPGRSHPLTRRAIASVRTGRVSAARSDRLSLLVSYVVELGGLLRQVIALRLFADGALVEQADVLALAQQEVPADLVWDRRFAAWAPSALAAANAHAAMIRDRLAADFIAQHQRRIEREDAAANAWLRRQSVELCGAFDPRSGDLFDAGPSDADWRVCADPEQRLSSLVADATIVPARRREAAEVLAGFRSVAGRRTALPSASVRMLGMLMLVA